MTKTPHEYIYTSSIRLCASNIRVHTGKKVRLEEGTPGIQGTGTPKQETEEERKNESTLVDSLRTLSRNEAGN